VLAYRFHDRPYRAVIHGQRSGVVIGKAPLDKGRVALVVFAALAVIAAIAAILVLHGHAHH
jgi:hypothetical protein